MSDTEKRTPRVVTVAKPNADPVPAPGTLCSMLMTVGARKSRKRSQGSYTIHGKAKRHSCPLSATRFINGKPYCDVHGPSKFRIDPFYDSIQWRELRHATLQRDGDRCQYCGGIARQADHIIPRSKGGADALSNLVACCATCNKTAASNVFPSFNAKKKWIRENRPKKRETAKQDQRPNAILEQVNRS